MLFNPSLLLQLGKALTLIMVPHEHPTHSTRSIQEGEELLHSLRKNSSYPTLLTYCLTNPPCLQPHATPTQIRIFLLLELEKYPYEIEPESAWWSLLEMYYSCNEKLEEMIIKIITKRMKTTNSDFFEEFINCVVRGDKWGISAITKCVKLIQNTLIAIKEIQGVYHQEFRAHVKFIAESLVQLLEFTKEQFSGFIDVIVILIMQTVEMNPDEAISTLSPLFSTLHSHIRIPPISTLLMYLSSILHKVDLFPFFTELPVSSLVCDCLPEMLSYKSGNYLIRPIRLVNSLVRNLGRTGEQIIENCKNEIVLIYWKYIAAKIEKYGWEVCEWDELEEECQKEGKIDDYFLLSVCLSTAHEISSLPSPLSFPILESFSLEMTTHSDIEIIMQYIHSYMHHSLPENETKIFIYGCFNYIYRFLGKNLNCNIIQVCQLLINFKTVMPEMKSICDRVLEKCTDVLITCQNMEELWNFLKFWISTLMANEMDIDACSFMPILEIIDVLDDCYFVDNDNFCFSNFIGCVAELICDELKSTVEILSTEYGHKNINFDCGTTNGCGEHGIFEIYYKLSNVTMKHILALYKLTPKEFLSSELSKLTLVLGRLTSLCFQNELYNPTTAFVYVEYLKHENDINGIQEFVGNMINESFWKGLPLEEVLFFGCVLVGLVKRHRFEIEMGLIYDELSKIASKTSGSNEESIEAMKNELGGFMGNIGITQNEVQQWEAQKDRNICHHFYSRVTEIFP